MAAGKIQYVAKEKVRLSNCIMPESWKGLRVLLPRQQDKLYSIIPMQVLDYYPGSLHGILRTVENVTFY